MENEKTIDFSPKEIYAMWTAVCRMREGVPYTSTLKYKLFALLSDEDRIKFYDMYEKK